jgi:hypothetical protein
MSLRQTPTLASDDPSRDVGRNIWTPGRLSGKKDIPSKLYITKNVHLCRCQKRRHRRDGGC